MRLKFTSRIRGPVHLSTSVGRKVLSLGKVAFRTSEFSGLPSSLTGLPRGGGRLSARLGRRGRSSIIALSRLGGGRPRLCGRIFGTNGSRKIGSRHRHVRAVRGDMVPNRSSLIGGTGFGAKVSTTRLTLRVVGTRQTHGGGFLGRQRRSTGRIGGSISIGRPRGGNSGRTRMMGGIVKSMFGGHSGGWNRFVQRSFSFRPSGLVVSNNVPTVAADVGLTDNGMGQNRLLTFIDVSRAAGIIAITPVGLSNRKITGRPCYVTRRDVSTASSTRIKAT